MTTDAIYNKALSSAVAAFENYKRVAELLRTNSATEQHARSALNEVIHSCWQLRDAAMLKAPAPLPPKPASRKTKGG